MSIWGRYWRRKRLHRNAINDKTKEQLMKIYDFVMSDVKDDEKVMKDESGNIRNIENAQTSS